MADPPGRVCSAGSSWHTDSTTEERRTVQEAGTADTTLAAPGGCTVGTVSRLALDFWQSWAAAVPVAAVVHPELGQVTEHGLTLAQAAVLEPKQAVEHYRRHPLQRTC